MNEPLLLRHKSLQLHALVRRAAPVLVLCGVGSRGRRSSLRPIKFIGNRCWSRYRQTRPIPSSPQTGRRAPPSPVEQRAHLAQGREACCRHKMKDQVRILVVGDLSRAAGYAHGRALRRIIKFDLARYLDRVVDLGNVHRTLDLRMSEQR